MKTLTATFITLFLSSVGQADVWTDKYLFKAEGSCSQPEKMSFNKLDVMFTSQVGEDDKGNPILMWTTFGLLPNGNYKAAYEEYVPHSAADGSLQKEIVFSSKLEGTWKVSSFDPAQVDLYDTDGKTLMFGLKDSSMDVGGQHLIYAFILVEMGSGAKGQTALVYTNSSTGAMNESAAQYCKSPY